MGLIRVLKNRPHLRTKSRLNLNERPLAEPGPTGPSGPLLEDSSGIALFMVLASVGLLAILVSEFTYISQISQMIAFGGLDQAKAHYIAKSGLKLSLLRLKAYSKAQELAGGAAGAAIGIPKSMIEKIWSFPFFYPIPTNIPGLGPSDKAAIEKFQKETDLDGKFSALIESESSKYSLNSILVAAVPSPGPSPTAGASGVPASPNPTASFSPDAARKGLFDFFQTMIQQKSETDNDFATQYRDFKLDEFVDHIAAWSDRTYARQTSNSQDKIKMKGAPFYSLSELHMLPEMDDDLYQLFAPALTASPVAGINVNTMPEATYKALIPGQSVEEIADFFKFRDSEDADNLFTKVQDFYDHLNKNVAQFKGNAQAMTEFQSRLAKANITLSVDQTQFKITVRAQVNSAVRIIEAWVTLSPTKSTPSPGPSSTPGGQQGGGQQQTPLAGQTPKPDTGLKITFMRIL
jgi:type II secretory pathway component PulK